MNVPAIYDKPLLSQADKPITFTWEGESVIGFEGDTIAAALWRNEKKLIARSFKYHRPRGFFNHDHDDQTALIQTLTAPNVNACTTLAQDGATYRGQNASPDLARDSKTYIQRLHYFLPAGFYYHSFFRPKWLAGFWENWLRKQTGLGVITKAQRGKKTPHISLHCDCVIIGGGLNGLAEAEARTKAGEQVVVIERESIAGGVEALINSGFAVPDSIGTLLVGTIATGIFPDKTVTAFGNDTFYTVSAATIVLATGRSAQLPAFSNNDLPGIISIYAALKLMRLYGVKPEHNVVIWSDPDNNHAQSLQWHVKHSGAQIHKWLTPADQIVRAVPNKHGFLAEIVVRHPDGNTATYPCDSLCINLDSIPNLWLARHAGTRFQVENETFRIIEQPDYVRIIGTAADSTALRAAGAAKEVLDHEWVFADTDEDLTYANLDESFLDGFHSIELLKRYSTFGMGPSQGKMSVLAGMRWMAEKTREIAEPFTTRPPIVPEPFSVLAGPSWHPIRTSALHSWHVENHATMLDAGEWLRPAYYTPQESTTEPASPYGTRALPDTTRLARNLIQREVLSIRHHVGLIDVSTLGGIDVIGDEAGAFIDRIYTGRFSTMPIGRAKYALLLTPAGTLADDGMIARLAENHYYITTTSGMSGAVYRELQFYRQRWKSGVDIIPMTSALAGISIAGPKAPHLLRRLYPREDFTQLQNAHLQQTAEGHRILRTGFTGEVTFEIHLPSHIALHRWEQAHAFASELGGTACGIEAQRILRLEKGHIIIGQDSDALTTLAELNMNWAIPKTKNQFIGIAAVRMQAPRQRILRGFQLDDQHAIAAAEKELLTDNCLLVHSHGASPSNMLGRITSFAYSPSLRKWVGLAFMPADSEQKQHLVRTTNGLIVPITVTPNCHYDPTGFRQTDTFLQQHNPS